MSQALMVGRHRMLKPPSSLLTDQSEQRTYTWLYDSIGDTWADVSSNTQDTISRTNYGSQYYNTIERLQFRIPGNAKIAANPPSQILAKFAIWDGQDYAGATVSIAATSVYRKTSGLSFTNVGSFPSTGNTASVDITSICASIDKSQDWYLQLQINLQSGTTYDSIGIRTLIGGGYEPYLDLTY